MSGLKVNPISYCPCCDAPGNTRSSGNNLRPLTLTQLGFDPLTLCSGGHECSPWSKLHTWRWKQQSPL